MIPGLNASGAGIGTKDTLVALTPVLPPIAGEVICNRLHCRASDACGWSTEIFVFLNQDLCLKSQWCTGILSILTLCQTSNFKWQVEHMENFRPIPTQKAKGRTTMSKFIPKPSNGVLGRVAGKGQNRFLSTTQEGRNQTRQHGYK